MIFPKIVKQYFGFYPTTLFSTCDGQHPLYFVLSLKNASSSEQIYFIKLMSHCGAVVCVNVEEALTERGVWEEFSMLLVDHDDVVKVYCPAFNIDFVKDCIASKRLLDISNYRQNATRHIVSTQACVSVFYHRLTSWPSLVSAEDKRWIDRHVEASSKTVSASDDHLLAQPSTSTGIAHNTNRYLSTDSATAINEHLIRKLLICDKVTENHTKSKNTLLGRKETIAHENKSSQSHLNNTEVPINCLTSALPSKACPNVDSVVDPHDEINNTTNKKKTLENNSDNEKNRDTRQPFREKITSTQGNKTETRGHVRGFLKDAAQDKITNRKPDSVATRTDTREKTKPTLWAHQQSEPTHLELSNTSDNSDSSDNCIIDTSRCRTQTTSVRKDIGFKSKEDIHDNCDPGIKTKLAENEVRITRKQKSLLNRKERNTFEKECNKMRNRECSKKEVLETGLSKIIPAQVEERWRLTARSSDSDTELDDNVCKILFKRRLRKRPNREENVSEKNTVLKNAKKKDNNIKNSELKRAVVSVKCVTSTTLQSDDSTSDMAGINNGIAAENVEDDSDSDTRNPKKGVATSTVSKKEMQSTQWAHKHSRQPYSREEQCNILRYIISHNMYSKIKGRELWQVMERRKICPSRTWQSMKEHYLKKIVPNLDIYAFLSSEQKLRIRRI